MTDSEFMDGFMYIIKKIFCDTSSNGIIYFYV